MKKEKEKVCVSNAGVRFRGYEAVLIRFYTLLDLSHHQHTHIAVFIDLSLPFGTHLCECYYRIEKGERGGGGKVERRRPRSIRKGMLPEIGT